MSPTAALRLAVVALLCLAGLTAADGISTCPNSDVTNVYNATLPCAAYNTCMSTYCTCQGATGVNSTTGQCSWGTSRPNCDTNSNCTKALLPCANVAAADTTCNVTALAALRLQLISLAGGSYYNGSATEKACQAAVCSLTNQSVAAANACNLTTVYSNACTAPYVYSAVLTLSGDWTAILANATATALVKAALTGDLSAILQILITITSLKSGSLIVGFTAPVSGSNPALTARVAVAASSSSWLTSTQAAFTSNGGSGSLSVTGIVAVTTAAPTPSGATTPATPAPTTAAPRGASWARSSALAALLAVAAAVVGSL